VGGDNIAGSAKLAALASFASSSRRLQPRLRVPDIADGGDGGGEGARSSRRRTAAFFDDEEGFGPSRRSSAWDADGGDDFFGMFDPRNSRNAPLQRPPARRLTGDWSDWSGADGEKRLAEQLATSSAFKPQQSRRGWWHPPSCRSVRTAAEPQAAAGEA
jgi:hypothetical protein